MTSQSEDGEAQHIWKGDMTGWVRSALVIKLWGVSGHGRRGGILVQSTETADVGSKKGRQTSQTGSDNKLWGIDSLLR